MPGFRGWGMTLLAGALYGAIGVGTAALSGTIASRYTAWALSAAVFLWHLIAARPHRDNYVRSAMHVALGVALGGLLLAVLGPVRSHWGDPTRGRLILLSVVAWPLLTGVPAFVVALGAEFVLARSSRAT